jgi:hypothetical protein
MKWINTITEDASQSMTLKLDTGEDVGFSLKYLTNQQGWYYSFTYGSFSISGRRIVASPNLIRSFREIIPFGFACTTKDGYEPIYKEDFANGRAKFFVLNPEDILDVEDLIRNAY